MIYKIKPVPKPRMTQRDRWKKRDCVTRYHAFKDEIRLRGLKLDGDTVNVVFGLPMPKSWSKKKRREMCGQPHQQKPDIDNLVKALLDATNKEDCRIWQITAAKYWSETGFIQIVEGDYAQNKFNQGAAHPEGQRV